MDLKLTAEQEAIRDAFHQFARNDVRPLAADLDKNPRFPAELFKKAGELGLFAMRYPEPDGTGADMVSYLLAMEELAWGSLSFSAAAAMQSLMGTHFVQKFSTGQVRERFLAPALAGELIGGICMTEPDSGSDLFSMTTRAEERDGTWYVTGQKTWVTSAPVAGMFTVFARTGEQALSALLVPADAPGVQLGKNIEKMGVKASLTSEVFFDDAPAACLLGQPGKGASYLREILAEIRLMTAGLALGVARAAMEDAIAYSKERVQFGKPIGRFQAIQAHLADMAVDWQAARQLCLWAAWRSDQGLENALQANMAKLFASEAALRICDTAARVFASYGYASEYPIERYLRDVRFTLIGGGTSEMLRINIAREL